MTYANAGNYSGIRLIITDANGCRDTLIDNQPIQVSDVFPGFTAAPDDGCAPVIISFTDTSSSFIGQLTSWSWDFGNGDFSTQQNDSTSYGATQAFDVSLVVENEFGCRDSITIPDAIDLSLPAVNFLVNDTELCLGQTAQFTNSTPTEPGITYLWNFGDGNSSTATSPSHIYSSIGTYTVCLTATNADGCDTTFCRVDYIEVDNTIADFTQDTTFTTCPPLEVNFQNLVANGTSFIWDFGDGSTATTPNPTHIYTQSGVYSVQLIAENAFGCIDTILYQDLITVGGPTGSFSFTPDEGCASLQTTFTVLSEDASAVIADFRDGTVQTIPISGDTTVFTHNYDSAGVFQPILILEDPLGCRLVLDPAGSITTELLVSDFIVDAVILCDSGVATFTPSVYSSDPGVTYQWSFPGGTPSTSTDPIPTVGYSSAGNYDAQLIVSNIFCSDTISYPDILEVAQRPIVSFTDSLPNPCTPDVFIFNNNSTSTYGVIDNYFWDFGDGNFSILESPTHVFLVEGNYDVTLIVETEFGCIDSLTQTITVSPYLDLGVLGDSTICVGISVPLSVNTGTSAIQSITWSPDSTLTCSDCPNPISTPDQTTIYTVTVVDSLGCFQTENVTVFVNAVFAEAGPDQNLCLGEQPTLSVTGGSSYLWSPASVLDDPTSATPTATISSNTTFIVEATSPNGCTAFDTVVVTINPDPVLSISNDTTICSNSDVRLTVTGADFYTWSPASSLDCSTCGTVVASPNTNTTYTVIGETQFGCRDTIQVTVNVVPVPSLGISPDQDICEGDSIQLVSSAAQVHQWSPNIDLSCSGCPNPVAFPSTTTTYTLSVVYATGCLDRDSVTITVNPVPTANAGADIVSCDGTGVQLNGSGTGTPFWSPSGSLSDATILNPLATPSSTTTYTLTMTDGICSASDQVEVEILPSFAIIASGDQTICNGDSVVLSATGATAYSWSPATGLSTTSGGVTIATPSVTTTYSVFGFQGACDPDTAFVTITVEDAPFVNAGEDLEATAGTTVTVIAEADPGTTLTWTPASDLSCSDCLTPEITVGDSTTTYTLTASTTGGCSTSDQLTITPIFDCENSIVIPNAFSPNGDGINDVFYVRKIGQIETFKIFNRWGELVFETDDVSNGWDGTYKGKELNGAVFVYYVSAKCPFDGSDILITGNVTLIR